MCTKLYCIIVKPVLYNINFFSHNIRKIEASNLLTSSVKHSWFGFCSFKTLTIKLEIF